MFFVHVSENRLLFFFRKPKTQRGKRFLLNRDAKLEENTKTVMLIRGGKTSEMVTQAMRDIVCFIDRTINFRDY